jgi:hypothetical protein
MGIPSKTISSSQAQVMRRAAGISPPSKMKKMKS